MTSRNARRKFSAPRSRGKVHTIGVGMHNFMDATVVQNAEQRSHRQSPPRFVRLQRRGQARRRMGRRSDVLHEPARMGRSVRRAPGRSDFARAAGTNRSWLKLGCQSSALWPAGHCAGKPKPVWTKSSAAKSRRDSGKGDRWRLNSRDHKARLGITAFGERRCNPHF